jgi:hypothetical protein
VPRHIDGNYAAARELLLQAGYTNTVLFAGKENGKAVWTGNMID